MKMGTKEEILKIINEYTGKPMELTVNEFFGTYAEQVEMLNNKIKDEIVNKLTYLFEKKLSKAVEEEHRKCKRLYVENVDWSEWGISYGEASRNFEEEYQELSKPKL